MMDTVSTQSSLLQFVDNNIPHAHLRSPPMLPGAAGPAAVSAGVKPTKICGHEVYFPVGKTPFSAQKSVISKALIALNKKQNALLESPTGTGKTLALLTSTLSWQKKNYQQALDLHAELQENQLQQVKQELETETKHVVKQEGVIKQEPSPHSHGPSSSSSSSSFSAPTHSGAAKTSFVSGASLLQGSITAASTTATDVTTAVHVTAAAAGNTNTVKEEAGAAAATATSAATSATAGKRGGGSAPKRKQIYFCARTHSQLQQSVDELKNCHDSYLDTLQMCILSSRKNLCVNEEVQERAKRPSHSAGFMTVEEGCQNLLAENSTGTGCRFNNMHTINRSGEELSAGGVWDIEDAVWMGRKHKSCPYFVSRKLHQARPAITFAPYSYLLNSSIRQATGVELKDAIVVFDEAHNIESACREASSCEVFLSALNLLKTQLQRGASQVSCGCPMSYSALHDLVAPLAHWLATTSRLLEHSDLENGSDHIWGGAEVLSLFADTMQLTPSSLPMFAEHLQQVVAAEEEDERQALLDLREGGGGAGGKASYINVEYEEEQQEEEEDGGGSGEASGGGRRGAVGGSSAGGMRKKGALATFSLHLLKDLFRIFTYMLRDDARCMEAYKLVVLRQKRGRDWDVTMHLWCLQASVAFSDFSECHSVILTSGTLSPLDSFSAELGMEFAVRVEAQHVIDTDSQVFATAISKFGNVDLKCTFQFHDDVRYQDALGNSLLAIRQASSAGMLVFFPSYGLLDKVTMRWGKTGLAAALGGGGGGGAGGEEGVEPGQGQGQRQGQDDSGVLMEPRNGKELEDVLAQYYKRIDSGQPGVLLAVCRGKISEGIDFADEYARTVCVVGIPFPSVRDLQVRLKRTHQDELCRKAPSSGYLPGDKWYCQEAFRAVNQAVGRCIRHLKDFGAIVLLDPRFSLAENQAQMSKWLRGRISSNQELGDVLVGLRSFSHQNRLKFAEHLAVWRREHSPPPSSSSSSSSIPQGQGQGHMGHSSVGLSMSALSGRGRASGSRDNSNAGMSGKQRAVVNMFNKYTEKAKTPQAPNEASSSPSSSSASLRSSSSAAAAAVVMAKETYDVGQPAVMEGSRLSDFTLDYFVTAAPAASPPAAAVSSTAREGGGQGGTGRLQLQGMFAPDRSYVQAQARVWRLSTPCLTREVPSSSSSSSSSPCSPCSSLFGLDQSLRLWDVVAVKLPPELSYLNTHLFRRDEVFMTDSVRATAPDSMTTTSSSGGGSLYPLPLNSVTYAVSLESWCWSEEEGDDERGARWRHRELWVPEDGVAYRVLEYLGSSSSSSSSSGGSSSSSSGDSSSSSSGSSGSSGSRDAAVLCAVTVVGANRRNMGHLDKAWMNIELMLALLQPQDSSSSSCSSRGGSSSSSSSDCVGVMSPNPPGFLSAKNILKASLARDSGSGSVDEMGKREREGEGRSDQLLDDDLFSVSTQQMEVEEQEEEEEEQEDKEDERGSEERSPAGPMTNFLDISRSSPGEKEERISDDDDDDDDDFVDLSSPVHVHVKKRSRKKLKTKK